MDESPPERDHPGRIPRIGLLEGVRGALALWVMSAHLLVFLGYPQQLPPGAPAWVRASVRGVMDSDIAVRVFMLLSGFVIFLLVDTRRERYRDYIARRFVRLFPAFACCLLAGVLVSPLQAGLADLPWGHLKWIGHQAELAGVHQRHLVANVVAHLTLLHGLIPKPFLPDAAGAFLGIGWTVSTEWQFYLVAPGIVALSRSLAGLAALGLAAVALPRVVPLAMFANETNALLILWLRLFIIGGCSYAAYRWFRGALALGAMPTRGLAVGGAVVACLVPEPSLAIWLFLLCCLCQIAAAPQGSEARAIQAVACNPVASFLGRISYALYLAHWPVAIVALALGKRFLGLPWMTFVGAYVATVVLATLAASAALHYGVEAPAIRWGNRRFGAGRVS